MAYDSLNLKKVFTKFSGGYSTQDEPNRISDDESPDMVNVRPIGKGAYSPRNGIRRLGDKNTTAGSGVSLYTFVRSDQEILIRSRGTTLEFLDEADSTWKGLPGVPTYTTGLQFGFANDELYVYGGNGVNSFFQWDGKNKALTAFTAAVTNVITSAAHGLENGDMIVLSSTTTLPAGLSAGTVYFVISVTTDTFKVALTTGGAEIDITDTGTGTHSFASSLKEYSSNPKGNIFEFYQTQLFISGNPADPATGYYSDIGNPVAFTGGVSGDFTLGEGGDSITALRVNAIASGAKAMFVFKESSRVFSITFDTSNNISILELKRDTGAVNQKSTINVENDILYVDPGNNIVNLGFRENIQNEIRTDSISVLIDRTTSAIYFDNPSAIYSKKLKMALYAGREFDSTVNNIVFAYFTDFKSWWRWKGINANQFAIYNGEIAWVSSVDQNVYKYDPTVFDDDYDETGEEGAGAILSYRATRDEEYIDRGSVPLADLYKQTRFVTIRGYISPGATMIIKNMYDGNEDSIVEQSFTGADENITTPEINVYFGSVVFGHQAFGGYALSETAFPMREFFAVVSLDGYSHLRSRIITEIQGAGTPYLVTMIALRAELLPEEKWLESIKI